MFLSRVEVAWPKARNPYDLHRAVWDLFPGEPREPRRAFEQERQGFLFRMEASRPGQAARLLVQSRRAPLTVAEHARVLGVREFDPQPAAGQHLAFLLTANPIKTIVDQEGRQHENGAPKKCRVPLIREQEQRGWLARKLNGAAVVDAASLQMHPPIYFRKNGAGKIVPVTFKGVLMVDQPELLKTLLENGIGPAKGFGCGLLLVRKL
ncbi:MAG: type I-E CRISPR-associated protein Cas6/Cse3/CasE [Pseudomonadota bacterium]